MIMNIKFLKSFEMSNEFFFQDGSYLAEFLLDKGYVVHGIIRRASSFNTGRIEHLYSNPYAHKGGRMKLHYGDLTDSSSLVRIICEVKPSEIYNLAAQSHVKVRNLIIARRLQKNLTILENFVVTNSILNI